MREFQFIYYGVGNKVSDSHLVVITIGFYSFLQIFRYPGADNPGFGYF